MRGRGIEFALSSTMVMKYCLFQTLIKYCTTIIQTKYFSATSRVWALPAHLNLRLSVECDVYLQHWPNIALLSFESNITQLLLACGRWQFILTLGYRKSAFMTVGFLNHAWLFFSNFKRQKGLTQFAWVVSVQRRSSNVSFFMGSSFIRISSYSSCLHAPPVCVSNLYWSIPLCVSIADFQRKRPTL